MPKRNAADARSGVSDSRSTPVDRPLLVVPRRWLATLTVVTVLPWLIAAGFYSRGPSGTGAPETSRDAAPGDPALAASDDPRPWGQLIVTPIVISPPLEYVPSNWGPVEPPRWYFHRTTRPQLEQLLTSAGLSAQQTAQLLTSLRLDGQDLVVEPDPKLVRGLDRHVRATLYGVLAQSPRNHRQRDAYRHFGASGEAWLGLAPISHRTRQLVEPLIYSVGDFVYFADIDLVRPDITDPSELQRLAKRLLREGTMLVRLRLDQSQLDAAVEYWGRGGRRTDIRPLLESVVSSGQDRTIDISHLLPTLAREHLYRYPRVALGDFDKPSLVNCFWTALNFFNAEPDDRYLSSEFAIESLKRDYFIIHDQLQLGDVVAFVDPAGGIFHAAVYLADGLVFGKNGTSHLSPWSIVPMDRLKGYYLEHADHWQVVYYRRNGT